jgi:hypothetical protein
VLVVVVVGLESKLSDQLWLSFSLALAKPNNDWLGLSPFVLGGGVTRSHQLLPGPGQQLPETSESKNPKIQALYFPAGWRASPALGAMQIAGVYS